HQGSSHERIRKSADMNAEQSLEMKYKPWIVILSIVVPLAVAVLFFIDKIEGYDTSFLPPIYATINGLTAVFLVLALIAIRNKRITVHRNLMTSAVGFSALFLVLYVIYHSTSDSTPFGGDGMIRSIYLFILISHILLSVIIIPLVLIT